MTNEEIITHLERIAEGIDGTGTAEQLEALASAIKYDADLSPCCSMIVSVDEYSNRYCKKCFAEV